MDSMVMLVDDDVDFRTLVGEALAADGIQSLQAGSGEECLQNVRNGFRGVILLDITMTGMDGWETLDIMAKEGLTSGNSICMLTSRETPPKKAEHLEPFVSGYIIKSGSFSTIVDKVREYLELMARRTSQTRAD